MEHFISVAVIIISLGHKAQFLQKYFIFKTVNWNLQKINFDLAHCMFYEYIY